MSKIEMSGLTKIFGSVRAVDGLTLEVESGEFISLLGPSGCGKTTTLQMLAGFIAPDAGTIKVDGQVLSDTHGAVPPERRGMAMVFQDYAVWPHKTVFENVSFGLEVRKSSRTEIGERVEEVLSVVGLDGMADRYPAQLSGGQQQRVSLARALVIRPKILLLDEPLSNLDTRLRDRMREELAALQRRVGITFVYVTHDQDEAMRLSSRIAVIDHGMLQQFDTPEQVYRAPANRFVAEFMGAVNLVPVEVVDGAAAVIRLAGETMQLVPGQPAAEPGPAVLCVRPEDVAIAPAGAGIPGLVQDVAYFGRRITYYIDALSQIIQVEAHPRDIYTPGQAVSLKFDCTRSRLI